MGYVATAKLADLFDDRPARVAARAMADAGGSKMVDHAVFETPVRSGNLRTSWYQLPVNRRSVASYATYESGVATNVTYAPHVEFGTGLYGPSHAKYPIRAGAGKTLTWVDKRTGKRVFRKMVMHPGSPGHHMVAIAAAMTERTIGVWTAPIMRRWVAETEALVPSASLNL